MSTTEFYPSASAEAAEVRKSVGVNTNWTTMAIGAGTNIYKSGATSVRCLSGTLTPQWTMLTRLILCFDTTTLPAGATITSARIRLYCQGKGDDAGRGASFVIYSSNPTDPASLVAADYDYTLFGTTALSDTLGYGDITTSAYNNWTLNASGLANITAGGISKFSLRFLVSGNWELEPSWNLAEKYTYGTFSVAGAGQLPILEVTYTDPLPDEAYRVTTLRHVYRPGSYRLEMGFGDVSTETEVPKSDVVLPSDMQPMYDWLATQPAQDTPKVTISVPTKTAPDLMKAIMNELNIPENMPQAMLDWESKYYEPEYNRIITERSRNKMIEAGAQGMVDWDVTAPTTDYRGRLSSRDKEPSTPTNIFKAIWDRLKGALGG